MSDRNLTIARLVDDEIGAVEIEGDRRPLAAWLKWWHERMPPTQNTE